MQQALILASGSPRRRDFIRNLGIPFEVIKPEIDERPHPGESPAELVQRLAFEKASAAADLYPDRVVLAADTIVVLDHEVLGKPRDRADAAAMLKKLSGRTHEVMTGVCVRRGEEIRPLFAITKVTFTPMSDELIAAYVASGESDDKSGSYAVQGIGTMFVDKVEGSVSSVVGLPCAQTRMVLEQFGYRVSTVRTEAA